MSRAHLAPVIVAVGALLSYAGPASAGFGDTDQDRDARWSDLQKQIFGDRKPTTDDKLVQLDVPQRADDAALVPIAIRLAQPKDVKAVYLVVDENPSPVAAHFTLGPDVDASTIRMRVRVNSYTNMHVVAETKDGKLIQTTRYVKASGGCSAPMGVSDEEAMRGMGEMRLKVGGEFAPGKPTEATLMVRHPNFNGMQMNQETRDYTPARYIQNVAVTFNDKRVFDLETDISLASNPVITFAMLPDAAKGSIKVDVQDSQKGKWSKTWSVPTVSN